MLRFSLVIAELLKRTEAEVPATPEPSAPSEEIPSAVFPSAAQLELDERRSECVVCMEREVRPWSWEWDCVCCCAVGQSHAQ